MHYRTRQFIVLLGDLAALYAGLFIAISARYWHIPGDDFWKLASHLHILFFFAIVILFIVGLYDLGRIKNTRQFFRQVILTAAVWTVGSVAYFYIYATVTPKSILLLTTVAGFGLLTIWRMLHNALLSPTLTKTRVIFAGFTPEVAELVALMAREPERGFFVAGCIGALPQTLPLMPEQIAHPLVANTLETLVQKNGGILPNIIVVTPGFAADSAALKELYNAIFHHVSILNLAEFYEATVGRIPPFTFSESWFMTNIHEQQKKVYDRFRIITDYIIASLVSIFFVVTFPFIALGIRLDSRGPIFFRQDRTGRGGKPFLMYKYRTMRTLNADGSAETAGPQFAAVNDVRVTAFGKFLRRTRIDEWPQCINILRGEMAVVGPRPERPEFVEQLIAKMPFYALRHLIKPGLTGWAQIHKSYYGTIEENLQKLEYDLYYLKNRGPLLDIVILLRTVNILTRMIGR